ncbi:MAG: penicillin-binding protein activator LpoB [Thermodesulfobacteriota bacterium]
MKKAILLFLLCTVMALGLACGPRQVSRVDTDKTIDLSGRWNDTDSRLVSEAMIKDALNRPWLQKFKNNHGGEMPTVIVGTVQNRSHEHINVETFIKDLERALINSGEVSFVADSTERDELRKERLDQASHASEETAKSEGEEIGADYMLQGTINTIADQIEGKKVMYYQVNLELMDIEKHRKVWIGEKKIKKFIKQNKYSF